MSYDGTLKFDTAIDASSFQDGISSIGSMAEKGLKATMAILTGAATSIGTLGVAAIKVGSDFEGAMSKVEAISGATGSDLEALTNKAKEMGASTKFSATESANAFEYMAMAGWKTEDMLDGIEGIMNLAAASGEDLATTSDIVTDALTAFGMSAQDSTHFADILAQASSNANTNVGMMGETFKYVAPVAGALGYSAEDTATAIGLMANAGIKSSQAGTSLRSIMSRLAKPTKEVQTAMDALGISLTNSDGSMKELNEVIDDLRTGFSGLSEAEAAQMAAALGGQEAMSGLLAIVNASDEDFNKLQSSIYSCDGAAAQMAETMNDNLQGQLTILKSGLEGLGISFYENIQTPLKDIAVEAQGMVQQLQDAFNEGGLTGMVTAFGDVLAQIVERVAGEAPELINVATGLVKSFCDSLKSSTGVGEAASSLITSLVTALFSCADDIWTTAIVLAGKMAQGIADGAPEMVQSVVACVTDIYESLSEWAPDFVDAGVQIIGSVAQGLANTLPTILRHGIDITLAIIAGIAEALPILIVQAANILIEICDAIVQNLPVIVEASISIVQALIDGLVSGIPLLLNGAIQLFMGIIEALPVIIEQLLQALPELITSVINFFTENIPLIVDGGIQLLMGIIEAVPIIVQAIVENLPQIITALVEGLVGALPQLAEASITLLMALIDAIPDIVVAVAENLPQIITAIVTGIANAVPTIFTAAKDLLWNIIKAIPDIVVGIGEAMPQIIEGIVNGLLNGISAIGEAAKSLGSSIVEGFKNILGIHSPSKVMEDQGDYVTAGLLNSLSDMPGKVQETIAGTADIVTQWGNDLATAGAEAGVAFVENVTEQMSELPAKVWTWLTDTITRVIQFGANMASKATSAAQGFVNNIVNGLSGLPAQMVTIGSNIVTGIWNGISSGWNWLIEKVKGLAESLIQGAKDALDINSPSKKFADFVGRWIPPGIGVGIDEAMPDLERQMGEDMDRLARKMQATVEVETGNITVKTQSKAQHVANTEYPSGGGDTYIDQHIEQENNYHEKVVTPSEVSKAQREAARNLLGGVK